MARTATITRQTGETQIHLVLNLDGTGKTSIATGVGFLDHMLVLLARHGLFDLEIRAVGDQHVDDHHTVEDVGICLGLALAQAVDDKRGLVRYGHMTLPMDETLVTVALDLSGRAALAWRVVIPTEKIGTFDAQLAEEFWNAVTGNARMNFHALLHYGHNSHHIVEAVFKAAARALRQAVTLDARLGDTIPSSKGVL